MSWLKKAKKEKAARGAGDTVKIKDAKSRWRILPGLAATDGEDFMDDEFWQDFGQHYVKPAPGAKSLQAVTCSNISFGDSCPICDQIAVAQGQTQDDGEVALLKDAGASRRRLFNAVRIDGSDQSVVVLETPGGLGNKIVDLMADMMEDDEINMIHPKTGLDVVITTNGKSGLERRYDVRAVTKPTEAPAGSMEARKDLKAFCVVNDQARNNALAGVNKIVGLAGPVIEQKPAAAAAALTGPSSSTTVVDDDAFDDVIDADFEETTAKAAEASAAMDDLDADLDDLDDLLD